MLGPVTYLGISQEFYRYRHDLKSNFTQRRGLHGASKARRKALRDLEQAQWDEDRAQRDAEQAQRDVEQAQKDAEQAQREEEQAESEAQQRQEEARKTEDAARAARSWEDRAASAQRSLKAAQEATKAAVEAQKAAEERLLRGIPPDVRPTAEQIQQFRERRGYQKDALNVALVGESGVGKSALLNAVRGLWPDDPGAAAVGINETTTKVQGYVDPRHPEIKWFDVPGANTPNVAGWLYFMNQGLYALDVLVVLFSDRFTQTAGTLLRNAHECGIPTYLVRTKADQLIQNLKKERRGRLTDAQARKIFLDNTREMVNKNLDKLELPLRPVFVVSVLGMREWVTEGDTTNVVDEQVILQALFRDSLSHDPSESPAVPLL
ncbi:hypothetical protein GALMADRAFT_157516 [Galerina marginata CBS 339.88]|uniref:IRG-type G domain-containing protein n=1 Tax=Galerina marginata (strain CBS 339.88) TaxID=685588 RepID=A0A067T5G3_GALM3|nr:hypothetical protein GALMADRAFT_157516 [Galerina marginata CBS 339.88]